MRSVRPPMSPLIVPVSPIVDKPLHSWKMLVQQKYDSITEILWLGKLTVRWPWSCYTQLLPKKRKDRRIFPSSAASRPTDLSAIEAPQLHFYQTRISSNMLPSSLIKMKTLPSWGLVREWATHMERARSRKRSSRRMAGAICEIGGICYMVWLKASS